MCTSINVITQDGYHVLGRTMDWDDLLVSPIFTPRHYQWASVFDHRVHENPYAIIGGGSITERRTDVSDGVNEFGLMAQKLTFKNGARLVDERHPDKVQLAAFELIFYLLGHFKSVADVAAHLDQIELMSDVNADVPFGYSEQHFVLSDPTGRCVVIEPSEHPLKLIDNPLGIMTNMPKFDHQLERLQDYLDFTPDFLNGTLAPNTFHVTTGKLSGKKTPPGAYTPKGRYVRAAYMKELADQPASKDEALATTWHLLDSVTVPKSKAHRPTFSVCRAATVAEDRTYYFQSYHQAQVTSVKLTDDLLKRATPLVFDTADVWAPVKLN
ncbi:choloylglycine hydrolase family protein [Limosilactobacillus fermentum]|uniref:choloylglycine hydrolase family protein n=1 Tax=Limosilactobacillus fermentum TaxID=1613 RepID=UPI003263AA70